MIYLSFELSVGLEEDEAFGGVARFVDEDMVCFELEDTFVEELDLEQVVVELSIVSLTMYSPITLTYFILLLFVHPSPLPPSIAV